MSKTHLEITARIPLPDDLMDAHPIQTGALALGKEFRDKLMEFAKKDKIQGVVIETKVVKAKADRKPRASKPTAVEPAAA